ncbi:MAG: PEP-CTERM sorting domain-containing protein [Verrucomicrobiota bacterium]
MLPARRPHFTRPALILTAALGLLLPGQLTAGVIATDGDVTGSMNAGGTATDPADYIIGVGDAVRRDFGGSIFLGAASASSSSHNRLTVRNAATATASDFYMSALQADTNNTLRLTGSSIFTMRDLFVGYAGGANQVTVEQASTLNARTLEVGLYATSPDNQLLLTGPGSTLTATSGIFVGTRGDRGTLTVANGARLISGGTSRIGDNAGADNNTIHVTGRDSVWENSTFVTLRDGNDSRLLITDQGLVTLGDSLYFGSGTGNFVGLDTGFLAFQGDNLAQLATWIAEDRFRFWNNATDEWLTADTDDLSFDYFVNDADALAFSGYEDLGGYTIITAGSPIPEPAAFAALAGLAALGLAASRRRRR